MSRHRPPQRNSDTLARNVPPQHNSAIAAVANTVGSIQRKENEYKEGIQISRQNSNFLAETLGKDGEIEKAMIQAAEGMNEEVTKEIYSFLQEQRERLKNIAIRNVEKEREIIAFIQSLNVIRDRVATSQENEGDIQNYEQSITLTMEDEKTKQQSHMENISDTKEYRELCELVGEKLPKRQSKKKRGQQDDDSDSDIEIENRGGTNLKCPMTAAWFEEPLRSKLCGHVYSKVPIYSYIGNHSVKRCPVAGCNNNQLNKAQLEHDRVTEMKVAKAKRAVEKAKQLRSSQAAGINDSDNDEM